ncbi:MAG: ATP-binding protein [Actinomycetota bacterium]|nr:ATP-binding protein [Actinomycetota bacterium]
MGATEQCPAIRLELDSTLAAPSIVRGAVSAVAEQLDLDPEFVDDLKTAVTEACNNVVMHAYEGAVGPLEASLYVCPDSVQIAVKDCGVGIPDDVASAAQDSELSLPDATDGGVGMPIMQALAGNSDFRQCDEGGTEVWMDFPTRRRSVHLAENPADAAHDDAWLSRLTGDAVISLSPVSLVNGVLGRVAQALAARARFSLDRFSDVYLATDAIATHLVMAAGGARIGFGVAAQTRHLEITIGPFRRGACAVLAGRVPGLRARSALALLADELEVLTANGMEMLRVVIEDRRRPAPASLAG